jgi:hypothetical protein
MRFFVVGDIGCAGIERARVADSMSKLNSESSQKCDFVIATGDNVYGSRSLDVEHSALVEEMLQKVPVPWFFCLGNHDVKGEKFEWHRRYSGSRGDSGWSWNCPCPAYSIDELSPDLTCGLACITVINTNKLNKSNLWFGGGAPPGPSPGFYESDDKRWWREQKESLERRLNDAGDRWKIVIGHHPAEYVAMNLTEHRIPGARYFKTTFMRGGRQSRKDRYGLNHILRRGADLYICGHQHVMAHMKLLEKPPKRPISETRCEFSIVGASSKLEQDPEDVEKDTDDFATEATDSLPQERYSSYWECQGRLGFAVVDVSESLLSITYYGVHQSTCESKLLHNVSICKDIAQR